MTILHSLVVVGVGVVAVVVARSAVDLSSRGVATGDLASSRESSKLVTLDSNVAVGGSFGSKRLVLLFLPSSIDDKSLLRDNCFLNMTPHRGNSKGDAKDLAT